MKTTISTFLLVLIMTNTLSAQYYDTLYSALTTISKFKRIEVHGEPRKMMYFQPNGVSGTPCAVLDSMNQNTYRILHDGTIYVPVDGMLERFICDDVNGGCTPFAMHIFDVSSDTNFIMGLRHITGSPNSPNCPTDEYRWYLSTNGGITYTNNQFNMTPIGLDIAPIHDSILIYNTTFTYPYGGWRSTNYGQSFSHIGIMLTHLTSFIKFNTTNDRFVYCGTNAGLYRSINYGYSFSLLNGVPSFNDMAFDKGIGMYGITSSGLFRSIDNGLTWTQVFNISCLSVEIDPDNDSVVYAGTNNGIYRSTNKGNTFYRQGFDFPGSNAIIGLSKDGGSGDTLIVCTQKGIYRVYDLNTGLQGISSSIPEDYEFKQNYPNPFNPSTNISFDIPEGSDVSLKIYDNLGREVSNLVNMQLIAGSYTYTWEATGLPGGTYFARFTARRSNGKSFIQTLKMVLVK